MTDKVVVLPPALVRWLARRAERHGFGAMIDKRLLLSLDEDGYSVLTVLESGITGRPVLMHEVQVLLKIESKKLPEVARLLVSAEDWGRLPEYDPKNWNKIPEYKPEDFNDKNDYEARPDS